MVKDGSFLVFKLFIKKEKHASYKSQTCKIRKPAKLYWMLNRPAGPEIDFDFGQNAENTETPRAKSHQLDRLQLSTSETPTSLSISCLLFILSSSYPRLSSSQLSFVKALHDNRKNSCAKRLRPRATDRSRLCSTPMNRRVPVQRSKFLHHTQCGYPPIMLKP